MTDVSASFRDKLAQEFAFRSLTLDHKDVSAVDQATRFFFKTQDGLDVSCVYLPYKDRSSLCVSTQVGCAWECVFCASGKVPFQRNLTPAEIVDQILCVEESVGRSLDSILFMGMGEPLAAYGSLIPALHLIRSTLGLHIGARHVTVSTCGLVPQIEKLCDEGLKFNLAISLHAADDELRGRLLPKAAKWTIRDLINAAKKFSKKVGGRVTFEYILLSGINDSIRDAQRLANMLRGPAQHGDYLVNLIAYNPVEGLPFERSSSKSINEFKDVLTARGVQVQLRKPQGRDIGAGCGQLGEVH